VRYIWLTVVGVFFYFSSILGQKEVVVNVAHPGQLAALLSPEAKDDVESLIVCGIIDARDFLCIRDELSNLQLLDISKTKIAGYSGIYGTASGEFCNYQSNEIPDYAFRKKLSLKKIVFPQSLISIGEFAFYNCNSVGHSVKLPDSLKTIKNYAFAFCSNLIDTIVFPTSLLSIGCNSFLCCTRISSIKLNNGLKALKSNCFKGCNNLKGSIVIPPSIEEFGDFLFSDTSLDTVCCPTSMLKYRSGFAWYGILNPPILIITNNNSKSILVPNDYLQYFSKIEYKDF